MYRIICLNPETEEKLMNAHGARERLRILDQLLKDSDLDLEDGYVVNILTEVEKNLREKYKNPMITMGFDTDVKADGTLLLKRYHGLTLFISVGLDSGNRPLYPSERNISVELRHMAKNGDAEIIIPKNVSEIRPYCFYDCAGIRKIVVPEGVQVIHKHTFSNCTDLEEVILPDTVTVIEDSAFVKCERLKDIRLPSSLTEIGYLAFCGCRNLRAAVFPDSVRRIGIGAFAGCTSLSILRASGSLAIPREYHVFFGCDQLPSSAVGYCNPEEETGSLLRNMKNTVNSMLAVYASRVNKSYRFRLEETEKPAGEQIKLRLETAEWKADLHRFLNYNGWISLTGKTDRQDRLGHEQSDFLVSVLSDLLAYIRAEIFLPAHAAWDIYLKKCRCSELISLRFLCVQGRWYAMQLECSD